MDSNENVVSLLTDADNNLLGFDIYLIKDNLEKAKIVLDNFNSKNGKIITETQLWSESLRSVIYSKIKEPDLNYLDKLESNCVDYEPITIPFRSKSGASEKTDIHVRLSAKLDTNMDLF